MLGEPLGVADGLISRQSAVHRLPQQVGQRLFGYSCLAGGRRYAILLGILEANASLWTAVAEIS
jgi:hypothetical protein